MSSEPQTIASGPVGEGERITGLDLIRGVAVFGILLMNVILFKFGFAPYLNLSAGGSETWLDWTVGVFGEIFIDQKFMGLFSLLFGAGVILFIDRAAARGGRATLLSLWRNGLLLAVGLAHWWAWDGDILTFYALSAFLLLALRRLPYQALIAIGVGLFLIPIIVDLYLQYLTNTAGASLAHVWVSEGEAEGRVLWPTFGNYMLRGLGMILLGAGLYRLGFISGAKADRVYRRVALLGLGAGLSLATLGVIITAAGGFSREVAFVGQIPNNLGTIPAALGYLSLIILWNRGGDNRLKRRLRAAGRMALTNYLSQTVLSLLILTLLLGDVVVNRAGMLLFVLAVWALQLWWSQAWLSRFYYGPLEWLWRVATYRRGQPLRRG